MVKKRKITGIITLIAICICTFAFAFAFAAEADAGTTTGENGAYTVTIPSEVTINTEDKKNSFTVAAELEPYIELDISVSSKNSYQLKYDDAHWLNYTLTGSDGKSIDKIVYNTIDVTDGLEKNFSTELNAQLAEDAVAQISGAYEDVLTFEMTCTESYPENTYELLFDANGGTVETTSKKVVAGRACGKLPAATMENCTFKGWFKEKEFYGTTLITRSTIMGASDTPVTLYAHWGGNWNVNINSNGGKLYVKDSAIISGASDTNPILSDNPKFTVIYHDGAYNNLLIDAVKEGYQCTGYFDDPTDGIMVWTAEGPCIDGDTYYKHLGGTRGAVWINKTQSQNQTFTFYPHWKANTYTVEYNKNSDDATGTMESGSHTYDQEEALTANGFSRSGYSFKGWARNPEATSPEYTDQAVVKNLTSENQGTVTLYAVWGKN